MRRTSKEIQLFQRRWLFERMPHDWDDAAPTRCRRCGVKFGPQAAKRICPKRRKPNRWRMHCQRAMYTLRQQRPQDLHTPAWWLRELSAIRGEVKRIPELQPDHPRYGAFWQYHKLARRYRRALREIWRVPGPLATSDDLPPDTFGGAVTRRRNALLREARETQRAVIRVKGCTYTFHVDAVFEGRPLFTGEEAPDHAG